MRSWSSGAASVGEAFDAQARRTINHPAYMVASDSVYHGALPHPRGYGCYAQVLGEFVRERGVS